MSDTKITTTPNGPYLIDGPVQLVDTSGNGMPDTLLSSAHFLVLPTRHDCSPLVLIEAGSFGVPCLATGLAGIPTLVHEDRNGWTFEPEDVEGYCRRIERTFRDRETYAAAAMSAFLDYEARLAWPVAAGRIVELLRSA